MLQNATATAFTISEFLGLKYRLLIPENKLENKQILRKAPDY